MAGACTASNGDNTIGITDKGPSPIFLSQHYDSRLGLFLSYHPMRVTSPHIRHVQTEQLVLYFVTKINTEQKHPVANSWGKLYTAVQVTCYCRRLTAAASGTVNCISIVSERF